MGISILIIVLWLLAILIMRARLSDPKELEKYERSHRNSSRKMPWE